MTRIRFEHVTKTFGQIPVIKDLNLEINEGEFFTFVGPSGCGKSTILNLIAGLEAPAGGSVYFDDRSVNGLSPGERDVAMVFQSYALYPHMTVRGNIAFPLAMRKMKKDVIDREVLRVAEVLGLARFLDKKPKELSGGQRQRVALGRAIVRKPKVFLMDEPLSNLDARLRVEMRTELKKLHHALGITTVYVTHDQSEALGLSDRVAVLNQGALQQCDAPLEIYRKPANVFVAGFIGNPPMNLVPAEAAGREPPAIRCLGAVFAAGTGRVPPAREFIAGIRPEDIRVTSLKVEGAIEGTVSAVEPAGPLLLTELYLSGRTVTGFASPDEDLQPGARIFAAIKPAAVALFDAVSGLRI